MNFTRYIILYASTDSADANIQAKDEYKVIQEAVIKNSMYFELEEHLENVNPDLLHSTLNKIIRNKAADKKIIFQLAGHSDRLGFYMEESSEINTNQLTIRASTIKNYFEKHSEHIECVIFSSCASVKLAEATFELEKIICSIGTNLELESKDSIGFTKNFYENFIGSFRYEESYGYAIHGRVLFEKSHIFLGKSRQKPQEFKGLLDEFVQSENPSKNIENIKKLKDFFSKVIDFCPSKNIDKSLYEQLKSIILGIDSIKPFAHLFEHFLDLSISEIAKPHEKIAIFRVQQKLLFEYPLLLTDEISQLLHKQAYFQSIPIILQDLIGDYEMSHIDFDYDNNQNQNEKIKFLNAKQREIRLYLKGKKDEQVNTAELYMKIYELIRVLIEKPTLSEVERAVKTKCNNDEKVNEIMQSFLKVKDAYVKYEDSVFGYIPNYLLQ